MIDKSVRLLLALNAERFYEIEPAAIILSSRYGFNVVYSLSEMDQLPIFPTDLVAVRSIWGTEADAIRKRGGVVVHIRHDISPIPGNLLFDVDVRTGDFVLFANKTENLVRGISEMLDCLLNPIDIIDTNDQAQEA